MSCYYLGTTYKPPRQESLYPACANIGSLLKLNKKNIVEAWSWVKKNIVELWLDIYLERHMLYTTSCHVHFVCAECFYVYVSKSWQFQETFSGCQHRQPAAASGLLLDAGSWRRNTAPSLCRCALLVSLDEELQGCSCIYAGLVGHDSWRWHHLIFFFFILSLCN